MRHQNHSRIYFPVSALIEIREVMASHGKTATERLNALTYIKAKATASNLQEISLSSEDLILCEEIMTQHTTLTFFDALHASVAISNKLKNNLKRQSLRRSRSQKNILQRIPKPNRKTITAQFKGIQLCHHMPFAFICV
jgi:hypothetical protein